ncbi:hypothetical protein [Sporosarcina sp. P33]|uniref:hypothetical protein n=1 Tax=Sporosarcina sp. P33 TaxID=1930764 RepID=UPI003510F9A0
MRHVNSDGSLNNNNAYNGNNGVRPDLRYCRNVVSCESGRTKVQVISKEIVSCVKYAKTRLLTQTPIGCASYQR